MRLNAHRWAIIGAGITGLSAAETIRRLAPHDEVRVFEAAERCGGVLQTERLDDGWLIEHAADMFATQVPDALQLSARCGIDKELLQPQDGDRRAFVVWKNRLIPVPSGFVLMRPTSLMGVLTTPLLSIGGKLRLLSEAFVPRRKEQHDESVASFVRRRMGQEVLERLIQPLVGGIYTADPERLSMAATMRPFQEMEQSHGSLLRAAWHDTRLRAQAVSGARYDLFRAPRWGMQQLVDAVRAQLPSEWIRLNTPVESVRIDSGSRWLIQPRGSTEESFDRLVLTVPSHRAAQLLAPTSAALAEELAAIPHASSAVVAIGLRLSDFSRPLPGFGCVVPHAAKRPILAISCTSRKFEGRAPEGSVLLRIFFGGALQPEWADASDDRLVATACGELRSLLGYSGTPLWARVLRWHHAMPQYEVGHLERVARIRLFEAGLPGLALAGAAYDGVGVPLCIHSAETQVRRLLSSDGITPLRKEPETA
jgi:oxygen-dependent protoporphyrinogen oxidase